MAQTAEVPSRKHPKAVAATRNRTSVPDAPVRRTRLAQAPIPIPAPVPRLAPDAGHLVHPTAAVVTSAVTAAVSNAGTTTTTRPTPAASLPSVQTVLGTVADTVNTVIGAAKQLMQAVLGPLVSRLPSNVPAQGPIVWTVLAWARKEIEQNLFPPKTTVVWPVTSGNLLVNPSAEAGDPSLSGDSSVTIPGWTVTGTPTVIKYGAATNLQFFSLKGAPVPSIIGYPGLNTRPTSSDVQFFGGGNVATSTLSQTVDLSNAALSIDGGNVPYNLSGWLGGLLSDPSAASLSVRFLAADGSALGTGKISPITQWDRWFQTGLLQRQTTGVIPIGTRSAQVVVTLKDANPQGYNNAYADDLSFTVGASSLTPATLTPPTSTVGQLDHVFMVYMENKGYGDVVGSPNAPYLNSLIDTYGLGANYYALTHPSSPNYYPILGGSDFGLNYNCATNCIDAPNLADNIETAGKTWAGYAQGMSDAGPYTATASYSPDQLPFLVYHDIYSDPARAAAHLFPLTKMATDLQSASTTPNFVWFEPNEAANMEGPINTPAGLLGYLGGLITNHQYNIKAGDQFLASTVQTILDSPVWNDPNQKSAIFLTFDEDANNLSLGAANEGNHVLMVAIPSPGAVTSGMTSGHFVNDQYGNHYSLLRTIEDSLGLPTLTNNDKYAVPLNGYWS